MKQFVDIFVRGPEASSDYRDKYIEKEWAPLCMLEMTVKHMTGKEAIELVKERENA